MISVITPNYNGERWLDDCLQSIASQTLSQDNIELVFIDDGSNDSSREIADNYRNDIPGLSNIWHEHTGMPGKLRNLGIERALGDYVLFLDSDDFLGVEALEKLDNFTKDNPSDIVAFQLEGLNRRVPQSMLRETIADANIVSSGLYKTLGTWKMCSTDFIRATGLKFGDLGRGEDTLFFTEAMLRAEKTSVVSGYPFYTVRGREDSSSITQQEWDPEKRINVAKKMAQTIMRWSPDANTANHFFIRVFNIDVVGLLSSSLVTDGEKIKLKATFGQYWNDDIKRLIYTEENRLILEDFFEGEFV